MPWRTFSCRFVDKWGVKANSRMQQQKMSARQKLTKFLLWLLLLSGKLQTQRRSHRLILLDHVYWERATELQHKAEHFQELVKDQICFGTKSITRTHRGHLKSRRAEMLCSFIGQIGEGNKSKAGIFIKKILLLKTRAVLWLWGTICCNFRVDFTTESPKLGGKTQSGLVKLETLTGERFLG